MNIETKHSPLPWEAEAPSLVVLDAYGNVVADCEVETFECERMANAELILDHIQICVRSLRQIIGYFWPRE